MIFLSEWDFIYLKRKHQKKKNQSYFWVITTNHSSSDSYAISMQWLLLIRVCDICHDEVYDTIPFGRFSALSALLRADGGFLQWALQQFFRRPPASREDAAAGHGAWATESRHPAGAQLLSQRRLSSSEPLHAHQIRRRRRLDTHTHIYLHSTGVLVLTPV